MAKMSQNLTPVQNYDDGLPVHFLTGKNYLYQTLFCIHSLTKVASEKFKFILVDDGSFDKAMIAQIEKQLPGSKIVTKKNIANNLDKYLPESTYPCLRQKRKIYPHLKKLTDIHTIPGDNWKLVMDSDMLFWKRPMEVISWYKNPTQPVYMLDCTESYGYSKQLMQELSGNPIPDLLNVGIIGQKSADIDWIKLENWIKTLEEKEGTSYYLEQALTAMLIGNKKSIILNADLYKVNPVIINDSTPVLHHYVDLSKKIYYTKAWKKVLS